MRNYNHTYSNKEQLQAFINEHNIAACSSILLQVFIGRTDESLIRTIIDECTGIIPHIEIIGTTTDGAIVGDSVTEVESVLSFMLFDATRIRIYSQPNEDDDSYSLSRKLISQFEKGEKAAVAITFTDGLTTNGDDYLKGFGEYDRELVVAGGMAGDNSAFEQTFVFTRDIVLSRGAVVALLYNPDLIVGTHAQYGWISIGKKMRITRAVENRVYEIDGISAVDIFAKYLGRDTIAQLPLSSVAFPLIKVNENITRAVVGMDEDGSLIFGGNLEVGEEVTFGYGNVEIILKEHERLAGRSDVSCSESIFVYSCMARKALMGQNIAMELKPLHTIAPVSGFFTYGEFYTNPDRNYRLLNQTMTILSLSEYPVEKQHCPDWVSLEPSRQNNILKSLANLITQTTLELEEKNSELQAEMEKNKVKDHQLVQQSRLAQMGEMLAMIAHQWRQPLAAISSAAITLKMKAELGKISDEIIQKKCNDILDYSQHLSTTINDFRNFFKPTRSKNETDFNSLIESTLNIIGTSLANHSIRLIREFECTEQFVSYPNEIMQVLLNLIKNAEDALIEQQSANPLIIIRTYCGGGSFTIEVEDNAGGIREEIIDSIFDPYFSTKINKNGTGLGLYMSRTIIEEHCRGTIEPINTGEGVIFRVTLVSLDSN